MNIKSLFLPMLLSACITQSPSASDDAASPYASWPITEIGGQAVQNPQAKLTLDRDEKRFNAKTGCNTLFGSYTLSDKKQLQFGAVASTLMACVDMDTEQRLGQALPKVKQYRFQGEALELLDEQGHTVVRGQRADKQ